MFAGRFCSLSWSEEAYLESKETYVYLHLFVAAIIHDQTVSDPNSVWFHRMTSAIGIISHIGIVEVGHFLGLGESGSHSVIKRSVGVAHGCQFKEFKLYRE
jgi:hypothetical protein